MARAARSCAQPGCPEIVANGYCPTHQRKPWSTGSAGRERGGRPWRRQRARCLLRDQFTCQWPGCGHHDRTGRTLEADHINDPTDDSLPNLRTLCREHHRQRTLEQSRAARGVGGTPSEA